MVNKVVSTKRVQISKATAWMVGVIAGASFITVFSLIASKALLSQRAYQSRVISAKQKAKDQLDENIKSVDSLLTQYKAFVSTPENIVGGSSSGTGDKDGDNAKIILDALPSKYDFPAWASSLEKLVSNYKTSSITASDDELAQAASAHDSSKPVEIPFQISLSTDYNSGVNFLYTLEKSIRPIDITQLSISASPNDITLNITAHTYYQPTKSLNISQKEVK